MIMKILLILLFCLSLCTPVYGKQFEAGLYKINKTVTVYKSASTSSKVMKKLKAGSVIAIEKFTGSFGISDQVKGYIQLKDCVLETSESELIASTKAAKKAKQIVVVNGPLERRNYKVSLWSKNDEGKWKESLVTYQGHVGKNGLKAHRHRHDMTTPIGSFRFTYAFGTHHNPGTSFTYKKLNKNSYWYYGNNTYKESTHTLPGEYLYASRKAYEYALFINFNEHAKVKSAGGAIFLHCYSSNPYTAGCVAINRKLMKKYITTIQPHARIIITSHMRDLNKY